MIRHDYHTLGITTHRYNNHSFMPPQNDADSIPDSLCDDTGERIGDLEQKLALSNASKDMVMEEIERLKSQAIDDCNELAEYRKENLSLIEEKEKLESAFIEVEEKVVLATDEIGHLKSVIEEQSQEIEDLNDACRGKAHIKAKIPEDKEKNTMTMIEEKDKFGNKIGGVKVVMAEEIVRLKSVIEEQSQEIKDLNKASTKRAHLEVRLSEHLKSGLRIQAQMHAKMYAYQKKCMALVEERSKLEEKLRRQKHELAKLNKKVENSSNYKREVSVNSDLMAKSDRQKKELAKLNKRVAELKRKASPETEIINLNLVAKIERQKKELAILNKLIEVKRK